MSFQAYLDNIKTLTGKGPDDFKKAADAKKLFRPGFTATQLVEWLKRDFGLGRGHAMAIYSVFKAKGYFGEAGKQTAPEGAKQAAAAKPAAKKPAAAKTAKKADPRDAPPRGLKDGSACTVIAGTHKGKSGIARDLKTSATGFLTITIVQANGVRFKTLAKNVSLA